MSILLPHSDDELFVLPLIKQKINEGYMIKIFFITSDLNDIREEESEKMLKSFSAIEIFKFGRLNKISDGNLKSCKDVVQTLLEQNTTIQSSQIIVTPMYEGGHIDHDEIFKIGVALSEKFQIPHYAFSLYNAYKTPFVRVCTLGQWGGPVKGELETIKFSFSEGLSYLRKSFFYRSQFVILSILFPGLLRAFILKRKIEILKVSSFENDIPHPGRVFYENKFKNKMKSFLRLPVK